MSYTTVEIHIEPELLEAAEPVLSLLGLDLSAAVNLFLHQVVLCHGIPFYKQLQFNEETVEAMEEAVRIARDPDVKRYSTMEELKAALEE